MKVLIADKFPPEGVNALRALGLGVITEPEVKDEALTRCLAEHAPDVLIVRSTKVQAPQFDACPSLALVIRAGAGVNTIDVDGASRRGVYVANCPGKNSIAVAELAFAHLLSLDRRLVDNAVDLRRGTWNKKEYSKAQGVFGRRLGLLGVGGIGQEMIPRAHAFGLEVVAWSRSLTPQRATDMGIRALPTPFAVAQTCDILSIHLALTPETRGLVGEDLLDALPDGAFVINTSRGEVVDQAALERAVKKKNLRVALDVFADEPTSGTGTVEPGIFALPSVQGTHHIGASTEQAQAAVAEESVRIVRTYVQQGIVPNCVNLADHADASHLLVVRHRDEVGVLAGVLDTLREAGINIQEMENKLFRGGDAACARIQIDREPGPELLEAVRKSSAHVLAVGVTAL